METRTNTLSEELRLIGLEIKLYLKYGLTLDISYVKMWLRGRTRFALNYFRNPKDEFDRKYDIDLDLALTLNKEKRDRYLNDLWKKRQKAHKEGLEQEHSL